MNDDKDMHADVIDNEDYEDEYGEGFEEYEENEGLERRTPFPQGSEAVAIEPSPPQLSRGHDAGNAAEEDFEDKSERGEVIDYEADEKEDEEEVDVDDDIDEVVDAAAAEADGTERAVSVIVRVRPLLQEEAQPTLASDGLTVVPASVAVRVRSDGGDEAAGNKTDTVRVVAREGTPTEAVMECGYDRVLGSDATQRDVFDKTVIRPAVLGVARGVSCCIFAYGQTSAGKTHTMLGEHGPTKTQDEWGVIPRAMHALFQALHREQARHTSADSPNPASAAGSGTPHSPGGGSAAASRFRFSVHCSMLQIYNEHIHDLLSTSAQYGEGEPLRIREAEKTDDAVATTELYVAGLSQFRVSGVSDVLSLLRHGAKARAVRATEYNELSSRSHAILQLVVETETRTVDGGGGGAHIGTEGTDGMTKTLRRAKLSLVDLAGSEKMNVSKDAAHMTKQHVQELTSINSSLSSLGNVIAVLADISCGKARPSAHVPYRDSKLTRLLQDSLGGNTRTIVVACVSPATPAAAETISTLKFADRAGKVMARVTANEVVDDQVLLKRAYAEIKKLKGIIARLQSGESSIAVQNSSIDHELEHATGSRALRIENNRLRDENWKLKERLRKLSHGESSLARKRRNSSGSSVGGGRARSGGSGRGPRMLGKSGGSSGARGDFYSSGGGGEDAANDPEADKEFKRRLTPPNLRRLVDSFGKEYSDGSDEDGQVGRAAASLDPELEGLRLALQDMRESGDETGARDMELAMLDAHRECRATVNSETDKLLQLRLEREELERQLASVHGLGADDIANDANRASIGFGSSSRREGGDGGEDELDELDEAEIEAAALAMADAAMGLSRQAPSVGDTAGASDDAEDMRGRGGRTLRYSSNTKGPSVGVGGVVPSPIRGRSPSSPRDQAATSPFLPSVNAVNGSLSTGKGSYGNESFENDEDEDDDDDDDDDAATFYRERIVKSGNEENVRQVAGMSRAKRDGKNNGSRTQLLKQSSVSKKSPMRSRSSQQGGASSSTTTSFAFRAQQQQTNAQAKPQSERIAMARALAERAGLNEGASRSLMVDHWPSPVHQRRNRKKNKQKQQSKKMQQQQQHKYVIGGNGEGLSPPTSRSVPSLYGNQNSPQPAAHPQPDKYGLFHSLIDVGARVRVYSYRYDEFYPATIVSYDARRGMHCCQYDDGDKQWHELLRKKFQMLELSHNAPPVSPTEKARSSASAPNGQLSAAHQHHLPAKQPTNSMPYIGQGRGSRESGALETPTAAAQGGPMPLLDLPQNHHQQQRPSSQSGSRAGPRPGSASSARSSSSRAGSRSGSRGMSRSEAAVMLRQSPYLGDPAPRSSLSREGGRGGGGGSEVAL